jgi:hypothetical protein
MDAGPEGGGVGLADGSQPHGGTPVRLVDGRYRLDAAVSRAAGTETWYAYDTRLDRRVVVDVVSADGSAGGFAALLAGPYATTANVLDAGDEVGPDGAYSFVVTAVGVGLDSAPPAPAAAAAAPAASAVTVTTVVPAAATRDCPVWRSGITDLLASFA